MAAELGAGAGLGRGADVSQFEALVREGLLARLSVADSPFCRSRECYALRPNADKKRYSLFGSLTGVLVVVWCRVRFAQAAAPMLVVVNQTDHSISIVDPVTMT